MLQKLMDDKLNIALPAQKDFLEDLYSTYQQNPAAVPPEWKQLFEQALGGVEGVAEKTPRASWARTLSFREEEEKEIGATPAKASKTNQAQNGRDAALDSVRAIMMIRAYRVRGHLHANLDPLRLKKPKPHPELDPASYGFTPEDWDRPIFIDNVLGLEYATIRQIMEIVNRTYCGTLGVEFMHISDPEEKSWIQMRIEGRDKLGLKLDREDRKKIMKELIAVEGFEKFLGKKYVATKRFGLDGAEMAIPAIEWIVDATAALGAKEVVIGMPHRGRLNVLCHVLGKPYEAIFSEFQGGGDLDEVEGSGDVKYHLGDSEDRVFSGNSVHLSLAANPSHLEIVDPVVLGRTRAKQDHYDGNRAAVLPILLHGDAAFAGQGVVAECLGLSGLKGHRSGGTIHFIVNNQIGFTTSPLYARSSPYPSDVGKMVEAPIFHVNGDDPESVLYAAQLAAEFRQKFLKPVIIDMFCYRRFGHNEGDNPEFTQPLMYQTIKNHPTVLSLYSQQLVSSSVLSPEEITAEQRAHEEKLENAFQKTATFKREDPDWLEGKWGGLKQAAGHVRRGDTDISVSRLKEITKALCDLPGDFNVHPIVRRLYDARAKMTEEGGSVDWAMAEALAFGSLLLEGYPVRLSGQDCERGTFSQRHSVLIDQKNENQWTPLNNLKAEQERYEVINSMLSEEAVLGFEYGYSQSEPNTLTIWEAQFGDFANGAQVVIDQFISSSEEKWLRMSGLVMLLPHGYEGQGPEHSSARLERYLQLCAEDNLQVANCTTPANYFHILRRQIHRNFRKPLILMTPKSLLRHKLCVSSPDDFINNASFHRVLPDDAERKDSELKLRKDEDIQRVVMCSGKVYYDLLEARNKRKLDNIYLLRLEQFYPFPEKSVARELRRFPSAQILWCQEEPKNMGAWSFIEPYLEGVLYEIKHRTARAFYTGRPAMASTATGFAAKHKQELEAFLDQALSFHRREKHQLGSVAQ